MGEVANQCDVFKAFDEAPRTPIAGTSTVTMFLGDLIVLHIKDVLSKYSILTPARPENPLVVWDAFVPCWISIFGYP